MSEEREDLLENSESEKAGIGRAPKVEKPPVSKVRFPPNMGGNIDASRSEKRSEQSAWDLIILFLSGHQWLEFDDKLGDFKVVRGGQRDTLVTVNLMLNFYRSILARLSLNYPSVVVLPASPSDEDINKAQASEVALRYFWAEADVKRKLQKAIEWLITLGTVGIHEIINPDDQSADWEIISPYDLFFEKDVSCPEDSEWIAIRSFHTRTALLDAYPEDKHQIIKDSSSTAINDHPLEEKHPIDRLELYEVYWKDGRHAHLLGNEYLYTSAKWPTKTMPLQVVRFTEIPTKLWGVGLLHNLVELQWFYNKSRSQILQNVELMGNPKWLVPVEAGVPSNALTNRAGEKVHYSATAPPPSMVTPSPLPSYVLDNLTRIQAEMGDVAGIHSVSLGRRAVGVSSGKAIDALSERDMSQLQVTQLNLEEGVRKASIVTLELMKKYPKNKMMRMLDETGAVVFHELNATQIVDDPEVFIEAGSLFRMEAEDRDAKVLELFQLGLLTPEQAMTELTHRTGNAHVVSKMKDRRHAQDLLKAVVEGNAIEIWASDDREVFIDVFSNFARTPAYMQLDEEIQNYIADVIIALNTFSMPPEMVTENMLNKKVWPQAVAPGQSPMNKAAMVHGQGSNMGQEQQALEQRRLQDVGNKIEDAVSSQQRGREALISRSPGQGGFR